MGPDYLIDDEPKKVIEILKILIAYGYDLNRRAGCVHSLLYLFAVEAMLPDVEVVSFLLANNAAAFPDSFSSMIENTWKQPVRAFLENYYATEVIDPLDRSFAFNRG
jgi:hypothetical protein